MLRLAAIEDRLFALERAAAEARRRQLTAHLRHDPTRLLAHLPELRRLTREDLDELADVLSRWDLPLSEEEWVELQRSSLVATAVSVHGGPKLHVVVEVVTAAGPEDLERAATRARIFTNRNRRAIPVVVALEPPAGGLLGRADELGVVLVVDGSPA